MNGVILMRRIGQQLWDAFLILGVLFLLGWSAAIALGDDFSDQLSVARNARGLPSVVGSSQGTAVSAENNQGQRTHGLGHWFTGGLGQCSAVGVGNATHALRMWTQSPAHAALIFSPNLTAVGFHCDGYCASVACSFGITQPVVARAPLPGALLPAACQLTCPGPGRMPAVSWSRHGRGGWFGWRRCR